MNINQIKNNKLKTILQFSIPSIIAMLLQTVITITDGYFTGNYVGDNALAAKLKNIIIDHLSLCNMEITIQLMLNNNQ